MGNYDILHHDEVSCQVCGCRLEVGLTAHFPQHCLAMMCDRLCAQFERMSGAVVPSKDDKLVYKLVFTIFMGEGDDLNMYNIKWYANIKNWSPLNKQWYSDQLDTLRAGVKACEDAQP